MEETTDWVYGFFSLLSDIISSEGDEEDDEGGVEDTDKGTKRTETCLTARSEYDMYYSSFLKFKHKWALGSG